MGVTGMKKVKPLCPATSEAGARRQLEQYFMSSLYKLSNNSKWPQIFQAFYLFIFLTVFGGES
jgi:hypothetical protein